jgi:hypothetical protein
MVVEAQCIAPLLPFFIAPLPFLLVNTIIIECLLFDIFFNKKARFLRNRPQKNTDFGIYNFFRSFRMCMDSYT